MQIPHESIRTLSLQSTSTRPLFSSSLSRARFPLLAAQNAALASGVSFCRGKMKQDLTLAFSLTWSLLCKYKICIEKLCAKKAEFQDVLYPLMVAPPEIDDCHILGYGLHPVLYQVPSLNVVMKGNVVDNTALLIPYFPPVSSLSCLCFVHGFLSPWNEFFPIPQGQVSAEMLFPPWNIPKSLFTSKQISQFWLPKFTVPFYALNFLPDPS